MTRCLACKGMDVANNAIPGPGYTIHLCDDCLDHAPSFAGWPSWTDAMRKQRNDLIAARQRAEREMEMDDAGPVRVRRLELEEETR